MRVTCERCLRRYDVPDATVKGRKIRARCKCGARVVVQDEERAARSSAGGSQTTGSIQRPVRWFVDITSWEPIAMDLRQLVRAFDGGRIDADTLVWRKGMPDWRRLRDVPELAERLMGAEAAAKAAAAEAPLEAASAESNAPPARQVERSRTPPANYSVDDRAAGEHASADGRVSAPPPERAELVAASAVVPGDFVPGNLVPGNLAPGSLIPGSEAAATLPGVSAVPQTPAGGYLSPTPPRARPRTERRSIPSAVPSFGSAHAHAAHTMSSALVGAAQTGSTQMGLAAAFAPAEPRTITQTGLAPAAEPGTRASNAPVQNLSATQVSAGNGEARSAEPEPEAVRPSLAAGAPAQRNSRSPTPAPGPRRVPSSDETPAQKPSSISVPSGALTQTPQRVRGKYLVAIVGLLLGVALMVHGTLSTDSGASAPAATSERHPLPPVIPAEPAHIENRNALALEPAPEPAKLAPSVVPASVPAAPPAVVPPPSKTAAAEAAPAPSPQRVPRVATAAPGAAAHTLSKPVSPSIPSAGGPILEVRPSPTEPAPDSEPGSTTGRGESAAPTARIPATPAPAAPPKSEPTPPPIAAAPTPASKPEPPRSPTATAPAPSAPSPPPQAAAGVFDEKRAREQMGLAAFKASTCGQLGDTRGAGQVKVVLEVWGRVVRVTHLNQAFVGTPVGLCIMQAFQQVQVPPFQGGAQSLTGSFIIQ